MLVEHKCGHEVNVPPGNAWLVRKTFCYACEEKAQRVVEEQNKRFDEALGARVKPSA